MHTYTCTDTNIYRYIFFHHTTCESTCDTLASSAANQIAFHIALIPLGKV